MQIERLSYVELVHDLQNSTLMYAARHQLFSILRLFHIRCFFSPFSYGTFDADGEKGVSRDTRPVTNSL